MKLAISKEGVDVGTATAANDFIFSTDYNTLKYYTQGSVVLTGSAAFPNTNRYYGTITHGLGYRPFFTVYVNSSRDASRYYPYGYINVGAGQTETACASTNGSQIRCMYKITNTSAGTLSGTVTLFYKIYQNHLGL